MQKAYWQSPDGRHTLYNCDCLDVLPGLGKVDAVVTDPPYGIGFKYESHNDTPEGYGEWLWSVIQQAEALCEAGSPVFMWQAMPNCRNWPTWFPRNFRLFAAAKNFVQMRPQPMNHSWDPVLVWWKDGPAYRSVDGTVNRDFLVADTASVISDTTRLERGHPCPRPIDHVAYIVDRFTPPDALILDPFVGSGTTMVAAARTGRRSIGIEMEQKYCDIAVARMERELERPYLPGMDPKDAIVQAEMAWGDG